MKFFGKMLGKGFGKSCKKFEEKKLGLLVWSDRGTDQARDKVWDKVVDS